MMTSEDISKSHIRHCLLYEFDQGHSARAACQKIREIYPNEGLGVTQCCVWFDRFRNGDRSLEDLPKSGRPSVVDNEVLRQLIESDPKQSAENMANMLGCGVQTIRDHLHAIGKSYRAGVWVPHQLTDEQKSMRVMIANSNLIRHDKEPYLKRLVTSDEKWILYENPDCHKQWLSDGQKAVPTPKPGLNAKKALLCVWWDWKGIIYWEVLPYGQTVDSNVYCRQLDQLDAALHRERPELVNRKGVILLHDNAKPHTSRVTQQKIRELGYEVLPHPPYSPDIAPSDYHLFQSLYHFLKGKTFADINAIKSGLTSFFGGKTKEFFTNGIKSLMD